MHMHIYTTPHAKAHCIPPCKMDAAFDGLCKRRCAHCIMCMYRVQHTACICISYKQPLLILVQCFVCKSVSSYQGSK